MARDESPEPVARADRRHPVRALLAAFVSADSYGLVLVLVVVTYLVSVSFMAGWAQSVVLAIQLVTVWLTFRTARTPLAARVLVVVAFLAVAAVAVVNLFIAVTSEALAVAFVVSAVLYIVAPFAVVRDIATRRAVDQETVLGAIAAYLIVGMCFAFTYRAIGLVQPTPFFGAEGPGDNEPKPVLQLRDTDHHRIRQPCSGDQSGAVAGRHGSRPRSTLPRHGRRQDHHRLETPALAQPGGSRIATC